MKKFLALTLTSLMLLACTGIRMLTPEEIYSPEFLKRIDGIQTIYKDGDQKGAIDKLNAMNDLELSEAEVAKKYNFLGIIYFAQQDFETAIEKFEIARSRARLDVNLKGQVYLNIASSYYKKGQYEKAYSYIEQTDIESFSEEETIKFYKLKLVLAQQLEKSKDIVESIIPLIGHPKIFKEVEEHQYKELLIDHYRKLSTSERVYLLEKFDDPKNITPAYLAKEEALQRYYMGDRPGAEDVLGWLENKYSSSEDVSKFIKDFQFRIENYSKIDVGAIGVVLPLSGEKETFGNRALAGIDSALNHGKNKVLAAKIYTRDSQDNPYVAQKMINDLIQKHHVSVIIGGLFPTTAREEYLEAKKYGVLYISLSPVHLSKEEKNHLLIEIPGSIQSQVDALMKQEFLAKMGKRVAVIYSDSEGGQAYIDEIWRKSQQGVVDIASIYRYEKNNRDYRDPVSKILGLQFKRERQEEFELWKEIFDAESKLKRSSIRRIQTLKPVIDFDWVFVPAFPQDAIQIIPVFSYFDAKKIKFIGGPSWMSRSLIKEYKNLGQMYFVGDDPNDFNDSFAKSFKDRNKKNPKLIETLAFEAMDIGLNVIEGTKFEKREELETRLLNLKDLKGITGTWTLKDGIWMKNMDFLKITSKKITKFDISTLDNIQTHEANEE